MIHPGLLFSYTSWDSSHSSRRIPGSQTENNYVLHQLVVLDLFLFSSIAAAFAPGVRSTKTRQTFWIFHRSTFVRKCSLSRNDRSRRYISILIRILAFICCCVTRGESNDIQKRRLRCYTYMGILAFSKYLNFRIIGKSRDLEYSKKCFG